MQMNDCMYILLYPPPFNPHDSHMHRQPIVINPCHAHSHTRSQAQITLLEMLKISFFLFGNKKQSGKNSNDFVRETSMSTMSVLSIACLLLLNNEPINTVNISKSILVNNTTKGMDKWTRHIDVCSFVSSMVRYRFLFRKKDRYTSCLSALYHLFKVLYM